MGDTYFLHEGRTKTGKPRYFAAKKPGEGALATIPEGFEFSESINAVVSVRRADRSKAKIPDTDIALARAELARHSHLCEHRIDVVKDEIVVFEPEGTGGHWLEEELPWLLPSSIHRNASMKRRTRYDPVMKFVPLQGRDGYSVCRMTYRGDGGWSWTLASGSLRELLGRFLRHVGTDGFFELM